jgi:APA family basic amino acid/polyamine antiporter
VSEAPQPRADPGLPTDGSGSGERPIRTLGALPAIALVCGSMMGIGIFISPPEVATHVSGPTPFMLLWLVGGLTALFGALSLAELGAMLPRDGGDYSYLRDSWGPGIAFAAGWLQLLAIFPGSLACVAIATSRFQLPVLFGPGLAEPLVLGAIEIPASHLWAAMIIVALTLMNHIGVKVSGILQVLVTSVPLGVLLITTLIVIWQHDGVVASTAADLPSMASTEPAPSTNAHALAHAYMPVYFAYSGWNAAIYVGGEIKNPARNLPRALVGGTAMVTALYLILCAGYLAVFSLHDLAGVGEAGTAAAQAVFGPLGVTAVTALIVLAMIGSLNGSVLAGSRIAFAMGKQGDCVRAAGTLDRKFSTPAVALWMQCGVALMLLFVDLVLFGDGLAGLIAYTSSAMLITGTLTVLAVVIFRRRRPELVRPYKTWFYPLPPLLYAASSLFVLGVLAHKGHPSVWIAVGWFTAALLFYRFVRLPRTVLQAKRAINPSP